VPRHRSDLPLYGSVDAIASQTGEFTATVELAN